MQTIIARRTRKRNGTRNGQDGQQIKMSAWIYYTAERSAEHGDVTDFSEYRRVEW